MSKAFALPVPPITLHLTGILFSILALIKGSSDSIYDLISSFRLVKALRDLSLPCSVHILASSGLMTASYALTVSYLITWASIFLGTDLMSIELHFEDLPFKSQLFQNCGKIVLFLEPQLCHETESDIGQVVISLRIVATTHALLES